MLGVVEATKLDWTGEPKIGQASKKRLDKMTTTVQIDRIVNISCEIQDTGGQLLTILKSSKLKVHFDSF